MIKKTYYTYFVTNSTDNAMPSSSETGHAKKTDNFEISPPTLVYPFPSQLRQGLVFDQPTKLKPTSI